MAVKTKNKMSKEDIEYWKKLCVYVEKEILGYDENQHMQKEAALRLKGLAKGKIVANNKVENNGNYSFKIILYTFKYCKNKIIRAIDKKEFNSEGQKLAYICAIARNNINVVYTNLKKAKKSADKSAEIDTTIMIHNRAVYQKRQERNNKGKYEELW